MKERKPSRRQVGRPKVAAPRESFTVRLKPEHRERIEAIADDKGVTASAVIQMAVAEFLKKEA
jgi:predicted DNA-binding protein